jgi:hypothetical protein
MKTVILIFFSIFCISTGCFAQLPIPALGDVDSSGSITIIDALVVAQHYIGLSPSPFFTVSADVNCDSTIDIIDALLVARRYVGLINAFEGCSGSDIVIDQGEVVFIDVEGGCIAIETDEGSYEPLGLPEGISSGMKIMFIARLRPDLGSICMVGTIIEIIQADITL